MFRVNSNLQTFDTLYVCIRYASVYACTPKHLGVCTHVVHKPWAQHTFSEALVYAIQSHWYGLFNNAMNRYHCTVGEPSHSS